MAVNSWARWMIEGWLNWLCSSWVGVVTATLEPSVPKLGDFWKSWEAHLYGVDLLSPRLLGKCEGEGRTYSTRLL